jgi:hypothetical protein
MTKTLYIAEVVCENCGFKLYHHNEIGTPLRKALLQKICSNCKCYIIQNLKRGERQ